MVQICVGSGCFVSRQALVLGQDSWTRRSGPERLAEAYRDLCNRELLELHRRRNLTDSKQRHTMVHESEARNGLLAGLSVTLKPASSPLRASDSWTMVCLESSLGLMRPSTLEEQREFNR